MLQKNIDKLFRKAHRLPAIPGSKIGESKKDIMYKIDRKTKMNGYANNYTY